MHRRGLLGDGGSRSSAAEPGDAVAGCDGWWRSGGGCVVGLEGGGGGRSEARLGDGGERRIGAGRAVGGDRKSVV